MTIDISETQLDTIADLLTDLPEQIARALFNQLYATIPVKPTPSQPIPPGGSVP